MTRLQDVRGALESTTASALAQAYIERVVFDNTRETPPPLPCAIASISFTGTITPSLGCNGLHLRGGGRGQKGFCPRPLFLSSQSVPGHDGSWPWRMRDEREA